MGNRARGNVGDAECGSESRIVGCTVDSVGTCSRGLQETRVWDRKESGHGPGGDGTVRQFTLRLKKAVAGQPNAPPSAEEAGGGGHEIIHEEKFKM